MIDPGPFKGGFMKGTAKVVLWRQQVPTLPQTGCTPDSPRLPLWLPTILGRRTLASAVSTVVRVTSLCCAVLSQMTNVSANREMLCKSGRCYTCLCKNHLSKDCRSNKSCRKCQGRCHVFISQHHSSEKGTNPAASGGLLQGTSRVNFSDHSGTQGPMSISCT